jgi:hypothetical protein
MLWWGEGRREPQISQMAQICGGGITDCADFGDWFGVNHRGTEVGAVGWKHEVFVL